MKNIELFNDHFQNYKIIGNLNEALNKLTVAINDRRGLTLRETKELLIFLRNSKD